MHFSGYGNALRTRILSWAQSDPRIRRYSRSSMRQCGGVGGLVPMDGSDLWGQGGFNNGGKFVS